MESIWSQIVAGLVVAFTGWTGGQLFERYWPRNRDKNIFKVFLSSMGKMLKRATKPGNDEIRTHAEAIVATRDQYRESLSRLSEVLNKEIDKVEELLNGSATDREIRDAVRVLYYAWPSKKRLGWVELERLVEVHKLEQQIDDLMRARADQFREKRMKRSGILDSVAKNTEGSTTADEK